MDETRRKRLAVIWVAFAILMSYVTFSNGFTAGAADLIGIVGILFGVGLAWLYYVNPNDVLTFGSGE